MVDQLSESISPSAELPAPPANITAAQLVAYSDAQIGWLKAIEGHLKSIRSGVQTIVIVIVLWALVAVLASCGQVMLTL